MTRKENAHLRSAELELAPINTPSWALPSRSGYVRKPRPVFAWLYRLLGINL